MIDQNGYSLANARRFAWSSISGDLNPDRIAFLQQQLIGKKLLDAGCGGGGYCQFLTQQGFDVSGVDLHEMFLELARKSFPHIEFYQADITQLPFADRTFDTVYCFDVLEHVDDLAALKELIRVSSKRVLLAVPRSGDEMFPYNLTFATYRDSTHRRYYSETSLRELIASVAPTAKVVIAPELVLPTRQLLKHLCDATRCGYLGYSGLALRLLNKMGFQCKNIATRRGERQLEQMAAKTWNPIFTGLTATIELT